MNKIIEKIEEIGIVPVIKLEETAKAVALAQALINGGINCAEVTFRAEGADIVIKNILQAFPDMMVGAGTILTIEQAEKAITAGAKFLVAPGFNPKIISYALSHNVLFIPGVSNPSEIEQALEFGLNYVKFFPAEQTGGINYIKALAAPYQEIKFMPTGGININNLMDYLLFDKVFACGGSWMVSEELIKNNKWDEITYISTAIIKKMLGFEIGHIGINTNNDEDALKVAKFFELAFGFDIKVGASSIFVSDGIEVMKSKYLGEKGHIAIKTNSIIRAMKYLSSKGFNFNENTKKYDARGKMIAIYLKEDFGGFAVHIVLKK